LPNQDLDIPLVPPCNNKLKAGFTLTRNLITVQRRAVTKENDLLELTSLYAGFGLPINQAGVSVLLSKVRQKTEIGMRRKKGFYLRMFL
jgi:hypothetical protein